MVNVCFLIGNMKKLALILVSFLAFACTNEAVPKPDHLLKEGEMVNILYDISILQAIKSYQPQALEDGKVDAKNYIYKKYSIDSLTFAQNQAYYASKLELYESIQTKLGEKIKKEKDDFKAKAEDVKPLKKGETKKFKAAVKDSFGKTGLDTLANKKAKTAVK